MNMVAAGGRDEREVGGNYEDQGQVMLKPFTTEALVQFKRIGTIDFMLYNFAIYNVYCTYSL